MLRLVQDWRRVTALRRASVCNVYGSWCPVSKGRGQFLSSDAELDVRCIGVAKNFSRFELDARLRRSFSYRLIAPIFARLILPPRSLICGCRRSWIVSVVWVAVEQSLTDRWGYMVRSRTMTRIEITSSIYMYNDAKARKQHTGRDTRTM